MKNAELLKQVVKVLHQRVGQNFKVTSRPPVKAIESIECLIEDELTALRAKYYTTQHTRLLPGIEVALKDLTSPSRRGRKPQNSAKSGWQLCLNFSDPDSIRFFHYYLHQRENLIQSHEEQKQLLTEQVLPQLNALTEKSYAGIMVGGTNGWQLHYAAPYRPDFALSSQEPELRLYHPASAIDDPDTHVSPDPFNSKRSKVLRMLSLGIKAIVGAHEENEIFDHPSKYYIAVKADNADIIQLLYKIDQEESTGACKDDLLKLRNKLLRPYKNGKADSYWDYSAPVPNEKKFLERLNKAIDQLE